MPRVKKRVRKGITKKDLLLKEIYKYKNVSSEVIAVLNSHFYTKKLISNLQQEGLIRKSSLKNSKSTVKKVGITAKIQRIYVTVKGQKYLKEKFPGEYDDEVFVVKNSNNDAVERAIKITDSTVMSEAAGAFTVKEKTEDVVLTKIVNENIYRGIFLPASIAKFKFSLTVDDIKHYRFTALTGVVLTPVKPYFLYNAGNGFISQTDVGEKKIAWAIIQSYARNFSLYSEELTNIDLINAIIFCKNIGAFSKLYLNKYGKKIAPGQIFYKAHVIPVSRDGCNLYKKLIISPDYKAKFIDTLVLSYNYKKTAGGMQNYIPLESENSEAVFVGIDFEINSFRIAQRNLLENPDFEYKKMVILCYDWQQEFYEEVINLLNTDKIICQPLDEDVLDEIIGFYEKVEVGGRRKS